MPKQTNNPVKRGQSAGTTGASANPIGESKSEMKTSEGQQVQQTEQERRKSEILDQHSLAGNTIFYGQSLRDQSAQDAGKYQIRNQFDQMGFQPQSFKSSRSNRQQVPQQNVESFLSHEELSGRQNLQLTVQEDFRDSYTQAATDLLFHAVKPSLGYRLLEKIGKGRSKSAALSQAQNADLQHFVKGSFYGLGWNTKNAQIMAQQRKRSWDDVQYAFVEEELEQDIEQDEDYIGNQSKGLLPYSFLGSYEEAITVDESFVDAQGMRIQDQQYTYQIPRGEVPQCSLMPVIKEADKNEDQLKPPEKTVPEQKVWSKEAVSELYGRSSISFVSSGYQKSKNEKEQEAARKERPPRWFGDWVPDSLLCKRFGVTCQLQTFNIANFLSFAQSEAKKKPSLIDEIDANAPKEFLEVEKKLPMDTEEPTTSKVEWESELHPHANPNPQEKDLFKEIFEGESEESSSESDTSQDSEQEVEEKPQGRLAAALLMANNQKVTQHKDDQDQGRDKDQQLRLMQQSVLQADLKVEDAQEESKNEQFQENQEVVKEESEETQVEKNRQQSEKRKSRSKQKRKEQEQELLNKAMKMISSDRRPDDISREDLKKIKKMLKSKKEKKEKKKKKRDR